MTSRRTSEFAPTADSAKIPGLLLVMADPADGIHESEFLAWYEQAEGAHTLLSGLSRIRHMRLHDEQLLPHRAARATHRYITVYDFDTCDDLAAAARRLQPSVQAGGEKHVDLAGAKVAAFAQVHQVVTPPELPRDAEPRPQRDVADGVSGTFMAFTRPVSAEVDAAYNEWYDLYHLPETLLLEGIERGRRHRRLELADLSEHAAVETPYLTFYDLTNVAAVPFNRDLMPWLASVGVDHLGNDAYDKDFTQAFIYADVVGTTGRD